MKKNILLLWGGGGTEHDISGVSSKYVEETIIELKDYNLYKVELTKDKKFKLENGDQNGEIVEINFNRELILKNKKIELHYAIPCIHGPPGETGEIQTFFELISLPYLGCRPEAGQICFNKVTSKLWFDSLEIPNTPFKYLSNNNEIDKAYEMFDQYGRIFIKAASQGSSVGCYQVLNRDEIKKVIYEAFTFSEYVIVEKMIDGRELEVSTYEYEGKVIATVPGEIVCPSKFYSFKEKYDPKSLTKTDIVAENVNAEVTKKIQEYAKKAFIHLKLRHLSRIDFFYTTTGEILLNEINTFPGMTPISMFPKMLENHGHSFSKFLKDIIQKEIL
jgi:D-alanine-D-alanine ligase